MPYSRVIPCLMLWSIGFGRAAIGQPGGAPQSAPAVSSADAAESRKTEADEAYRQGQYEQAISLLNQVIADSPQDHVAFYLRGSARVELGVRQRHAKLIRQGITDAREALRIEDKGNADYYLPYLYGMTNLAVLEQKPSHAETARSVASQVLERGSYSDEQRANIIYQRGLADIQSRAPDAARDDFREAIRLKPDHLAAYVALCNLTNELKGPEEALAVFNQAVAAFPANPLLLNNRAMHFHSMGREQEAHSDFAAALRIDPSYVPALINRGYVNLQQGNSADAESDLSRALEIEPKSTQAYTLRGTARINLGKTKEAIEDYRRVLELEPANGIAAADLGFAEFFRGRYAQALQQFDAALKLDPSIKFLTPWRYAAAIRSQHDLANDPGVKSALARNRDHRTWFDWLTLFEAGQVGESELLAAANLPDAATRNAQLCEAYYFIGLGLLRQNKPDEARAFFRQAIDTDIQRLSAFRGARVALHELGEENASTQ